MSWQHCLQAARGREETEPICVYSCRISEQHSNLVNIILLNTESHRSEAIFTEDVTDLCIIFPACAFTVQSGGLHDGRALRILDARGQPKGSRERKRTGIGGRKIYSVNILRVSGGEGKGRSKIQ